VARWSRGEGEGSYPRGGVSYLQLACLSRLAARAPTEFARGLGQVVLSVLANFCEKMVSYGPPWAHYLSGYQDRLLGGPLGLPALCRTVPDGMRRKDYGGKSTRIGSYTYHVPCRGLLDVHD
jgi:hypothetical protein